MPEMHLRQPQFTKKNKERIEKLKQTGDTKYIYRNELDKAYFQRDMAYGDFKDLAKRTCADKALILLKILNMMGASDDWLVKFINFLIKRVLVVGCHILINLHLRINNS